jgi:hypothetical protein
MAKVSIIGLELTYIACIGFGLYSYNQNPNNGALGIAIFGGISFFILNCMLYCYKDKLAVAIAVIDAAADYYAATKRLIFVSLFFFLLHIIVFGLMVTAGIFMYS